MKNNYSHPNITIKTFKKDILLTDSAVGNHSADDKAAAALKQSGTTNFVTVIWPNQSVN